MIEAILLLILRIVVQVLSFKAIYNWYIPELFNGFPVLNNTQSLGIVLIIDFILVDKANHIADDDESISVSFLRNCTRYAVWTIIAYILKCLFI